MMAAPVEGWMGAAARRWLRKASRNRWLRIIEVGVWKGRTTRILAKTGGHVWAVDHWRGVPNDPAQHALYEQIDTEGRETVRAEFFANIADLANVSVVEMDSAEAADQLLALHGPTFDLVFIDADHSYEGCSRDIAAYRRLLASGGLLSGHDYKPAWPGVMRAVDEAFNGFARIGPKSIWSIRP